MEGYNSLDGVVLVVNGGGRAGEVVDLVDLQQQWFNDVVADEFEPWVPEVVHNVLFPAGEEVVDHDHAVPSGDQTVNQMATHEAGATSHDDPQPLLFQAQWNLPAGIERPDPGLAMVDEPVLASGVSQQV